MARAYRAGPHLRRLKIRPSDRLLAHARRLGLSLQDAEDVVQDLYLLFPKLLRSCKPIPDLFAYLVGCVHGRAVNFWTREQRRARLLEQQPPADDIDPGHEDRLIAAITAQKILDGLPPADAELLRWRFVEDRPIREIAEHLGIPEGTARVRLHRALTKAQAAI